jgi:hypothetical protein
MSANESQDVTAALNRLQGIAVVVAVIGIVAAAIGAFTNLEQFFHSYHVAFVLWTGVAAGCLGILMLHHMVGGGWGYVTRRFLESGAMMLPFMFVLSLPILFGVHHIFEWSHEDVVRTNEIVRAKTPYLNTTFFVGRTILYFLIWTVLAFLLDRQSTALDRNPDPTRARFKIVSGPGILIHALVVTFYSIDFIMSLEPEWFSSIFGLLTIVSQSLAALALCILMLNYLRDKGPFRVEATTQRFHDLGNLSLAHVMLWAYMAFSQYLISWSGNLPEEAKWYLNRLEGGWRPLAVGLVIFHFFLPFFLLLSRQTKRRAAVLAGVAVLILLARLADIIWLVEPAFNKARVHISWMDIVLPIGMGGIWMTAFVWYLKRRAIVPAFKSHVERVQGEEALSHG